MSYLEIAKEHSKLGMLLKKDDEISKKAAKEYATKNEVTVEDITSMRVRADLLLGMNRAISAAIAREANKRIPKDVIFDRVKARDVELEWIYVPGSDEMKIFFHLFGGGYIMGNLDTRK